MSTARAVDQLDDAEYRAQHDPAAFHCLLERLPEQARDAWRLGLACELPETFDASPPRRVLLVGVGGSAIGADVAATLAGVLSTTPVAVVRDYQLPPLDAGALVLLCSFSGQTEETLEALRTVVASDATGIALTTGGALATEAAGAGISVVRYQWAGPPRTGFGYGVFLPLAILRRLGVLAMPDAMVEDAFAALECGVEAWGPGAPGNEAQEIATWLLGASADSAEALAAIVGAGPLEVAARRWAGELSENACRLTASYAIPEFDHNQLEAAAAPPSATGALRFVLLDAPPVHPRNRLRVTHTAAMLASAGREVRVVDAGGANYLEAILAACSLGSWTAYHLALLRGSDPATTARIDELKARLAGDG